MLQRSSCSAYAFAIGQSVTTEMAGDLLKKRAERVRVRGVCAAGHTTETTTEKGRVTRTLECSDPGCHLEVLCKRISSLEPPIGDTSATLPSGAKVRRVSSYGGKRGPGAGVGTTKPTSGGAPTEGPSHDELLVEQQTAPGFTEGTRATEDPPEPELIPGLF